MIQSSITGQIVSQITVQVTWADQNGNWALQDAESYDFVVVPRCGETVFFPQDGQSFDVIEVCHCMDADPYVVVVLQEPE